jgi:hypothetical protein
MGWHRIIDHGRDAHRGQLFNQFIPVMIFQDQGVLVKNMVFPSAIKGVFIFGLEAKAFE